MKYELPSARCVDFTKTMDTCSVVLTHTHTTHTYTNYIQCRVFRTCFFGNILYEHMLRYLYGKYGIHNCIAAFVACSWELVPFVFNQLCFASCDWQRPPSLSHSYAAVVCVVTLVAVFTNWNISAPSRLEYSSDNTNYERTKSNKND